MNSNPLRGLYDLSIRRDRRPSRTCAPTWRASSAPPTPTRSSSRATPPSRSTWRPRRWRPALLEPGDEVCHLHHGAPLQPHPLAAGVPRGRREPGVPAPRRAGRHHARRRSRRKIGPRTQHRLDHPRLQRAGRDQPRATRSPSARTPWARYVVVDGAQSVPHMPVDVAGARLRPVRFLGAQAHGPAGRGRAVGPSASCLRAMPPFLTGGEMIDSVTEQDAVWAPAAREVRGGHAGRRRHLRHWRAALDYVEGIGLRRDRARASRRAGALPRTKAWPPCPTCSIIGPTPTRRATRGVVSLQRATASTPTTWRACSTRAACACAPAITARSPS